jgi:hypothetical protein
MNRKLRIYRCLGGLALMTWSLTGCKTTNETERPQVFTVVALFGDANYQTADSDKWHVIKIRDRISPGSVITTASGAGNYLDIIAGEMSFVGGYRKKPLASNQLRIYQNSVLKLEKITTKTVAGKKIGDTRLRLLKGAVRGYTGTSTPPDQKVETIARRLDRPYYEIRTSNIVVHMQHAGYLFTMSGKTVVAFGAATLEFIDTGETKDLPARHWYDPATGVMNEFDYSSPYFQFFQEPDFWRSPDIKPSFELPRRLF